jgi:hypothetical protein
VDRVHAGGKADPLNPAPWDAPPDGRQLSIPPARDLQERLFPLKTTIILVEICHYGNIDLYISRLSVVNGSCMSYIS